METHRPTARRRRSSARRVIGSPRGRGGTSSSWRTGSLHGVVDVAPSGNSRDNENEGDDPTDREHRDGDADEAATGEPAEDSAGDGAEDDAEPAGRKRRRKGRKPRSFWKELPILIGVALLLALLIQTFIARVFVIPSESMEQTLHGCPGCYGDRVLVDKLVYRLRRPRARRGRGLRAAGHLEPGGVPVQPLQQRVRVVAAGRRRRVRPGRRPTRTTWSSGSSRSAARRVECCDDKNRVLVDGKPLDESYVYWTPTAEPRQESFAPLTIPEGMLFVLGDNRNNSCDSRYQGGGGRNGLVPVDNVIGKVRWIVLPPSRWQGVGDHNPQATGTSRRAGGTAFPSAAASWSRGRRSGSAGGCAPRSGTLRAPRETNRDVGPPGLVGVPPAAGPAAARGRELGAAVGPGPARAGAGGRRRRGRPRRVRGAAGHRIVRARAGRRRPLRGPHRLQAADRRRARADVRHGPEAGRGLRRGRRAGRGGRPHRRARVEHRGHAARDRPAARRIPGTC